MNATIQKWGNSLALRIPGKMAEQMHLGKGDSVEIGIEMGTLTVRAARPRFRLADLVEGIDRTNRHSATEWNGPVGREVW